MSSQVRCLVDVPGERLPSELALYLSSHVAPQVLVPGICKSTCDLERPSAIPIHDDASIKNSLECMVTSEGALCCRSGMRECDRAMARRMRRCRRSCRPHSSKRWAPGASAACRTS